MRIFIFFILIIASASLADTINNQIKIKGGTDGTLIGNTSDSLKVTGTSTVSGNVTVVQPTGTNLHAVIDNFPSSPYAVTQSGIWSTGRTWTLLNTTDSVNVGNFPSTYAVTQSTSPWVISGTVTSNIGTTGGLALDSTLSALSAKFNSLGQKTMANSAPVVIASDQSSIPVTGTFFQSVQPVSQSGTWTVQQGTPPWSVSQSGTWTTGRTWNLLNTTDSVNVGNFPSTYAVTQSTSPWVTSRNWNLSFANDKVDASGSSVSVSNFPATQPVSGTVTANQGTGGASAWKVDGSAVTQPISGSVSVSNFPATQAVTQSTSPWVVSGTVTANAGTNLNTSLLELDTTGAALNLAQASTTSGQTGPLIQGAVTTSAPSYTTAKTSPLSLNTSGGLRVDGSGVTQPISGTVAATQSGTWTNTVTQATASNLNAQVVGNVASGATDSGNPVKIGGVFNTTLPTLTNGQRGDIQLDATARLIVRSVTDRASMATGRTHFHCTLENQTASATCRTITVGKTAYVTNYTFSGINTSSAANGRLNVKDGTGGTMKFPHLSGTAGLGAITASIPFQQGFNTLSTEPEPFTTSIRVEIDSGTVTYSFSATGYEE